MRRKTNSAFSYSPSGKGRPQVLLIGNGLERTEGQPDWADFLEALRCPGRAPLTEAEREALPFPLLYQLLSTPDPAPARLGPEAVTEEEQRLAKALELLQSRSNPLLDRLPQLGADHVLSTNYSYCLEKAFYRRLDFSYGAARSGKRFSLLPPEEAKRELAYRLHTGYLAKNADRSPVGLWHIHGETTVPRGVVVGHDRYGRLLSRMVQVCGGETVHRQETEPRAFRSWPELFLFGDVYVLGQGFALCEHDLWWLLRRKQRERYGDGIVYFYDNDDPAQPKTELRNRLLRAHGVQINPDVARVPGDYAAFYHAALDRIGESIKNSRA